MLTPAPDEYTDAYSAWLATIPQEVKELVFVVKRFYKAEWGDQWREHFSVDIVNGVPAHELKCDNRKLVTNYLRVGYDQDGLWRTFGLRKDFQPAVKLQLEAAVEIEPRGVRFRFTRWVRDDRSRFNNIRG